MRFIFFFVLLVLAMAVPMGCATNETDPARVSAWDLTFGKSRLNRHIDHGYSLVEDRKQTERVLESSLERLTQKTNLLNVRLQEALGRLAQARIKNDGLYRQILARKNELDQEKRALNSLMDKLNRVPSKQLVDEVLAVEERVNNLNDTITDLFELEREYLRDTR